MWLSGFVFFFFKQKTAYEMRISDWSSDVCSSDLSLQWRILRLLPELLAQPDFARPQRFLADDDSQTKRFQLARKLADLFDQYQLYRADRSEERRVRESVCQYV